jgi:hypothetical protein
VDVFMVRVETGESKNATIAVSAATTLIHTQTTKPTKEIYPKTAKRKPTSFKGDIRNKQAEGLNLAF